MGGRDPAHSLYFWNPRRIEEFLSLHKDEDVYVVVAKSHDGRIIGILTPELQDGTLVPFLFTGSLKVLNYLLVDADCPFSYLSRHWWLKAEPDFREYIDRYYISVFDGPPILSRYKIQGHPDYKTLNIVHIDTP